MKSPDFWNNQNKAKKVNQHLSKLKDRVALYDKLCNMVDDLETYKELLNEDYSATLLEEAVALTKKYEQEKEKAEIKILLKEETDSNDAIIQIHPGAGGTESQDWAEMLLRLYKKWAEKNDYQFKIIDLQPGDDAGLKNVTAEIIGEYAFGNIKCEIGIHRLVRISPFNAQGKRQTSFASVFAYPLIKDEIEIDINPKDIRVDTYRASGAGGQHVNTTDSAIRITHEPTGIIVQCQNERSQIQNRETAMKILKSRLYQIELEKKQKEKRKLESSKSDIGWGNQIRSYVFHPYQMVKDHRTNYQTGKTNAVLDGEIDDFIHAYLKYRAYEKRG